MAASVGVGNHRVSVSYKKKAEDGPGLATCLKDDVLLLHTMSVGGWMADLMLAPVRTTACVCV